MTSGPPKRVICTARMHVRLGPAAVVNGAGLQREADGPSDFYVECAERQSATMVPLDPGPVWVLPTGLESPRAFFNLDWITLLVMFVITVVGAVYFFLARPDRGVRQHLHDDLEASGAERQS